MKKIGFFIFLFFVCLGIHSLWATDEKNENVEDYMLRKDYKYKGQIGNFKKDDWFGSTRTTRKKFEDAQLKAQLEREKQQAEEEKKRKETEAAQEKVKTEADKKREQAQMKEDKETLKNDLKQGQIRGDAQQTKTDMKARSSEYPVRPNETMELPANAMVGPQNPYDQGLPPQKASPNRWVPANEPR